MKLKDIKTGGRYFVKGVQGWDRDYYYKVPAGYDLGGYATVAEDQTDAYVEAGRNQTGTTTRQKRRGVRVIWAAIAAGTRWDGDKGREEITVVIPANRVIATEADHKAQVEAEAKAKEAAKQREIEDRETRRLIADAQEAKCKALGIPYYRGAYDNTVRITLKNDEIIALAEAAQKVEA